MSRMVKIFCSGAEQDRMAEACRVIERYQGFVLAEVAEERLAELAAAVPVEDITDAYAIRLEDQVVDTTQPRVDARGRERAHPAYKGGKRLAGGPHHYLVQFIGPIKEDWLSQVEQLGGRVRSPFEGFSYVVRLDQKSLAAVAGLPFVRWLGHLPHQARIAAAVLARGGRKAGEVSGELPRSRVLPGVYLVEFFDADDLEEAIAPMEELGLEIVGRDPGARLVTVRDPASGAATARRLRELAALHGVRFIRERSVKRTANDVAARILGTSSSQSTGGLGLSGEGEIIGICDTGIDTGNPASIHPDFAGRIAAVTSYPITADFSPHINNPGADDGPADLDSGHGTHVAGSVLGSGAASSGLAGVGGAIRGLAYRARLAFQAVEQALQWKDPADNQRYGRYLLAGLPADLGRLFADAYGNKVRIHSNSWGGGDPGAYDAQCEQLDRFVWEHKDFCVLFAAGNDGSDRDGDGKINPMSVTSPGTAKNCITVGASENERAGFAADTYGAWWPDDYPVAPFRNDPMASDARQLAAFSSRGPTADGRIKPDVVAPGTFILSTRSTLIAANNTAWSAFPPSRLYFYMGGTSMATPLCAGAVALVREYLRKHKRITNPTAALLKATLVAGAVRLPGYGEAGAVADTEQGYGRVHLDGILAPSAPGVAEFLEVSPGLRTGEIYSKRIEVGAGGAALKVVLCYSDYPGAALVNNLNLMLTAPDGKRHVGNQAGGGLLNLDGKNNVEAVNLLNPTAGSWLIEVAASNVPQGPQDFALVYTLPAAGSTPASSLIQLEAAPALAIPDNAPQGVTSELNVTQSGTVGSVKIGVDIAHPYIGDLRVVLTAPGGTAVVLHDRSGAGADDLVRNYDAITTPALANLAGLPVQGQWRLAVADLAGQDLGQLRRWSLEIAVGTGTTVRRERTPALAIPDNDAAGITDTAEVAETGAVRSLKVWVDITHPYIGDLRVQLVAPSGRTVSLHDRSGGSRDNLIKTYDAAALPALQGFAGESLQGAWRLRVSDLAGRDVGKLNRWGFEVVV